MPTGLALPESSSRKLERLGVPASNTAIALGPPARRQVGPTSGLVSETPLELLQGLGEIGPTHARTLPVVVFGVNPIGRRPVNPGFRSVSTLRCPNDLGDTGWVNPALAEAAQNDHESRSEWSTSRLRNRLRNELDSRAWERLVRAARRGGMSVDELLRSTLEVHA
jgi:hypothetical protein